MVMLLKQTEYNKCKQNHQIRQGLFGAIFDCGLHLKASLNSYELDNTPCILIRPGQCESSSAHLIDVGVCDSHQSLWKKM